MTNLTNLKNLLSLKSGITTVYFQPPSKLTYPCILCQKSDYSTKHADNLVYNYKTHYTVTVIGNTYDNETIINGLLEIPYCSYDRRFISDNLYHDEFDLYY